MRSTPTGLSTPVKPPAPIVRQISPARHAHINFRGAIVFPIDKFAERPFQDPMSKGPTTGGLASAAQHWNCQFLRELHAKPF